MKATISNFHTFKHQSNFQHLKLNLVKYIKTCTTALLLLLKSESEFPFGKVEMMLCEVMHLTLMQKHHHCQNHFHSALLLPLGHSTAPSFMLWCMCTPVFSITFEHLSCPHVCPFAYESILVCALIANLLRK